ncbi:MAG TPA: helix-turn-helix transcriptional regulator [Thermoanaerobaculia bacterium]|jgi:transcriptional regulator with XRE-family HTH domain
MPRKPLSPTLGTALTLLRTIRGWHQNELAAALRCGPPLVCDYEAGRKPLSRKRLDQILAVLGLPSEAVELTLSHIGLVHALSLPEGGSAIGNERCEAALASLKAAAEAWGRSILSLEPLRRAEDERWKARRLWERVKALSPARGRALVESDVDYRSWALCELICERSLEAAADRADRARDLAGLAVRIAELAPGLGTWRKRLQGYALAHLANARRVGGDLPAADRDFACAWTLWEAGACSGAGFLDEARVLHLVASLRKDQRRLPEAIELLDQALAIAGETERKKLLVNRANVLTLKGDFEDAIATLQTMVLLIREDDPLLGHVWFTLANNLLQTGRPGEADALLPRLREFLIRRANDLEAVRFRWLEGRVAAGLGKREEAVAALVRVREDLAVQKTAYDFALVSIELAVLYLENGRIREVQSLARQMLWIFRAQGVHREAIAAFKVFCEAVERETMTAEIAQELVGYLYRARHDPSLRFETDGLASVLSKSAPSSREDHLGRGGPLKT